jgi:hypothetical protein
MAANPRILSASATPAREFTTLLSPAVAGWLSARGCESVAVLPADAALRAGEPATAEVLPDGHAIEFRLTPHDADVAGAVRLQLKVNDTAAFSTADLDALGAYLTAVVRFPLDGTTTRSDTAVLVPNDVLRRHVHDLRNHLNSMLMSASVVSSQCKDPVRYGRYIEQVETEGDKCARALTQLSETYL